ncbi:MAG: DUF1841 family protein [Ectothiorhodospiraceae bacterium]|nr:DUF1841 family protein [Ectothiorhodospiraceae bacterium]
MFGQDRNQLRQMYLDAWQKSQAGAILQPLEAMIAEIISQHPEYHAMLNKGEDALDKDFSPEQGESNPFMHMGMHIAIREQLGTDRPAGISAAYKKLLLRLQDAHAVEHQMMECLGQSLWEAQRNNTAPDENQYLLCVQKLAAN